MAGAGAGNDLLEREFDAPLDARSEPELELALIDIVEIYKDEEGDEGR